MRNRRLLTKRESVAVLIGAVLGSAITFFGASRDMEKVAVPTTEPRARSAGPETHPNADRGPSPRVVYVNGGGEGCVDDQKNRQCEEDLRDAQKTIDWLSNQGTSLSKKAVGLSDEELRHMAKICELRIETPGPLGEADIKRLGLSETEIAAYQDALDEVARETKRLSDAAYEAAYDEPPGDAEVNLFSLMDARRPDDADVRKRMAEERAGMREPPREWDSLSPYEQYFRALASRGERMELALAARLGEDRARKIHTSGRSWPGGVGMHYRGCEQVDTGQDSGASDEGS